MAERTEPTTIEDAELAYSGGQLDLALLLCADVLRVRPDDTDALRLLADTFLDLHDFEAAEEVFRDLLRLQPDLPEGHCGLGVALFELCQFDEARRSLESAVDLDPRNPEGRMYLAYFHERRGEDDKARAYFQRAVDLAPDHYQLPVPLTDSDVRAAANHAIHELPPRLREYLSSAQWTIESLPSTALLTRIVPPLSPLILCLFLGPTRHPNRRGRPLDHKPRAIALYRSNFGKVVNDEVGLRQSVRNAVLAEMEMFLDLDADEVEELGLHALYASSGSVAGWDASAILSEFDIATIPPDRTLH